MDRERHAAPGTGEARVTNPPGSPMKRGIPLLLVAIAGEGCSNGAVDPDKPSHLKIARCGRRVPRLVDRRC